jgi:hypothetical protein
MGKLSRGRPADASGSGGLLALRVASPELTPQTSVRVFKLPFSILGKLLLVAIGIAIGAGGVWYLMYRGTLRGYIAERRVVNSVDRAGDSLRDSLPTVNVEAVKQELARTGRVVFEKAAAAGAAIADTATDIRITTVVKAKFANDRVLTHRSIGVSTTRARVKLTGQVATLEEITKAMLLAYDTPDVLAVESELRLVP